MFAQLDMPARTIASGVDLGASGEHGYVANRPLPRALQVNI